MTCARGELRLCHGFELAVVWRAIELIDQMFAEGDVEVYEIDSLFVSKLKYLDWVFGARTRAAGSSGETAIDGIVKADPSSIKFRKKRRVNT